MTNARDDILDRIRTALTDRPDPPPTPRNYYGVGQAAIADPAGLLAERIADYRAYVERCTPAQLVTTIKTRLEQRSRRRVVIPIGLDATWIQAVDDPIYDEPPLSVADLDHADGVLTSIRLAIATTGTLVLDHGPGQGRRALTLVPDYHLAVVSTEQIVSDVPDAIARLDPTRPQTWISGPSATSDIELERVEGVHGPRTLDVIIVG
jgi:L-lactate dehydrogenase complex protein LldG